MKKNYSITEIKKLLKKKSIDVMIQSDCLGGQYKAVALTKHEPKEWIEDSGFDYSGWAFELEDDYEGELYPVEGVYDISVQQSIKLKLTK
jgi:hypothetical protein